MLSRNSIQCWKNLKKIFRRVAQKLSGLKPQKKHCMRSGRSAKKKIAETGSISITENEGNARLSCAFPKTHIVIAGLEKIIPSLNDLGLFLPLLATFGTGQQLTVYNTIISGPKQKNETDGPEEMYVI